jgi:hypothetical protein
VESEGDPIRKISDPRNNMRLGRRNLSGELRLAIHALAYGFRGRPYKNTHRIAHGIWDSHPDQSGSCIWNPKATLYETYWIPPDHFISGIWNPKVTLYEKYWIPHGRSDSHPDHAGSCIWIPKATLYEKYPIPEI